MRQETAIANTEACLVGITKEKLSDLQQQLLKKGEEAEYFVIESVMKGNFLVKDEWRREHAERYGFSMSTSTPRQNTHESTK